VCSCFALCPVDVLCEGVLSCPLGITELSEPVSVDIYIFTLSIYLRKQLSLNTLATLLRCGADMGVRRGRETGRETGHETGRAPDDVLVVLGQVLLEEELLRDEDLVALLELGVGGHGRELVLDRMLVDSLRECAQPL
jgi:hypothetical protein